MNRIRLDFDLVQSCTVEDFWDVVYRWLSKSDPLHNEIRECFVNNYKELQNFNLVMNYSTGGIVSIKVFHDETRKSLFINIITQRETKVTNYNIVFAYKNHPRFLYEELVSTNSDGYYAEFIRIPRIIRIMDEMICSSNRFINIYPVLDSNGQFERDLRRLATRYRGIANVYPVLEQDFPQIRNTRKRDLIPGKTLIMQNGNYNAIFYIENIERLDWYILCRSTGAWRNKEKYVRY